MTELKRYSIEPQQKKAPIVVVAPKVLIHQQGELDISPTPSKSIHRSKTVRNLGSSAGNKMRGLFKSNKNKENVTNGTRRMTTSSTDENGFMTRPILSTSASFGPGSELVRHEEEPTMYSEQATNEVDANKLQQQQAQQQVQQQVQQQQQLPQPQQPQGNPTPAPLPSTDEELQAQQELEKLNELIAAKGAEVQQEKQTKERLQMELNEAQRIFKEREAEYSAIEHSFFEHTRAIRATDDDLSTIRDSFKLLKYSIARLIMTLNKKADKSKAATKFVSTWPHLTIVDTKTGEMEPSFVNLLSEKLVHEHLVKNVFNAPIYPGLKVNDAYFALNNWLQAHNSQFSIRLRQQMAAVVAKSNKLDSNEIHQVAQKEKQKIACNIYDDLAEIYYPFLRENDAIVEEEKRYYNKICDIVDKAMKLTIAIRGQEVEIVTVGIEEGNKQQFEEETMTEVKGRNNGLVRFCICPTFMGGDREHGFLEKGKVVISS